MMARALLAGLGLALAALLSPAPAALAQDAALRFEVAPTSDTTFTFPVGKATWVKAGTRGIAVDPRKRDMLVARFVVTAVDRGVATARVTGITTDLAAEHVAVIDQPRRRFYTRGSFWLGLLIGGAVGGAAATAL
jgi:hypothetical protein